MFDRRHPLGVAFLFAARGGEGLFGGRSGAKKKDDCDVFCFGRPAVERCCNFPSHREREPIQGRPKQCNRWRRTVLKCFHVVEAGSALRLSDFLTPVLERFLELGHKLVGDGAVDEAVVIAEGQMHERTDRDGIIAIIVCNDDWRLRDSTHAQNGSVRLINDGQSEDCAKLARVVNGES
jgi:hypothetical protein